MFKYDTASLEAAEIKIMKLASSLGKKKIGAKVKDEQKFVK